MQPYIPYFVIEALVADRERDIERLNRQPTFSLVQALRRRTGTILVRLGTRLQRPVPKPALQGI